MAAHTITHNKKPAEVSTPGGLNLVFSTTHPPRKEQVNVSYHDNGARVQVR